MKKSETDGVYNVEFYRSLQDTTALKERLNGRLPMIDIAGHPFIVDVRMGLLRPKDNFTTMGLDIDGGQYDPNTKLRSIYYHIPTQTTALISPDITELPKDVIQIRIPDDIALDPVGMARSRGFDDTAYLHQYPLKMYSKAEIVPLDQTPLVALVKKNLAIKKATPRKNAAQKRNRGL